MKAVTDRQKAIATYIANFIKEKKYSPSVRDISHEFGFSVKAGHDHLKALERKGIIRMTAGVSRSIELIDGQFSTESETVVIPLLGTIAAGKPLLSEENIEYNLDIPVTLLPRGNHSYFALHVRGQSMIEAGINDGDIVIIEQCENAEAGEIVAASVDEDGITLKRFYPNSEYIELRPCNRSMGPIRTQSCHIHGKLALLVRTY